MKTCSKCKKKKPLTEFHRHGKNADGTTRYESRCKSCISASRKASKERGRASQRLTFICELPDQDHTSPSHRKAEYLCQCGEVHVANKYDVRSGNTASCGCAQAEANTTHGQSSHPLYEKAKGANQRAKAHGQPDRLTVTQVVQLFNQHGWSCYYCGLQSVDNGVMTLDHVVPFARGGQNTIQNCVPACWDCNYSKRDKTESEFNNEQV